MSAQFRTRAIALGLVALVVVASLVTALAQSPEKKNDLRPTPAANPGKLAPVFIRHVTMNVNRLNVPVYSAPGAGNNWVSQYPLIVKEFSYDSASRVLRACITTDAPAKSKKDVVERIVADYHARGQRHVEPKCLGSV